jgi:hypothetical protein
MEPRQSRQPTHFYRHRSILPPPKLALNRATRSLRNQTSLQRIRFAPTKMLLSTIIVRIGDNPCIIRVHQCLTNSASWRECELTGCFS